MRDFLRGMEWGEMHSVAFLYEPGRGVMVRKRETSEHWGQFHFFSQGKDLMSAHHECCIIYPYT